MKHTIEKVRRAFGLAMLFGAAITGMAQEQQPGPVIAEQGEGSFGLVKLAFGADGKWLASVGQTQGIRIYDLVGGRMAFVIRTAAKTISIHPEKRQIAALESDRLTLYDASNGNTLWSVQQHSCNTLQFSGDGSRIYGACQEPQTSRFKLPKVVVKVWDGGSGRELSTVALPEGLYSVSGFSPDGRWLAAIPVPGVATQIFRPQTAAEMPIAIVETDTGRRVADVPSGMALAISAAAHRVVTATKEGIMLWDTDTGKGTSLVSRAGLSDMGMYGAMYGMGMYGSGITPDGYTLVIAGSPFAEVDLRSGQLKRVDVGEMPALSAAAVSPDGGKIAISQGNDVLLLSVSNPADRRIIGNPSSEMIPSSVMKADPAEEGSYQNLSKKEQRKVLQDYGRKTLKAKPAERQRLSAEMKVMMNGDPVAKKAAEKRREDEMISALKKFGAPCGNAGMPSFINGGSAVALVACDYSWDVWDVATGNRLPFRKEIDLEAYRNSSERMIQGKTGELRELEAELAGTQVAAKLPVNAGNSIACSSESGDFQIEFRREGGHVTSALFRPREGEAVDLLGRGMDLSKWGPEPEEPGYAHHDFVCSLNREGTRVILEKAKPPAKLSKRQAMMQPYAEERAKLLGKTTADRLILYNPRTGEQVCELENQPKRPGFDVFADEFRFSPDRKLLLGGGDLVQKAVGRAQVSLQIWDAATCKLLPEVRGDGANFIGFSEDGSQFFTAISSLAAAQRRGEDSFGVRVWDAKATPINEPLPAKPRMEIPAARASPNGQVATPAGNVLLGLDRDSGLGIWDRTTGEKLGSLRAFQEGEWLVTTPSGLFDGSPRGWTTIAWRDSADGISTQPGEIFFNEFYRPGLLADLLAGRRPAAPRSIAQVDRRQPKVSITSSADATAERTIALRIEVEEASPTAANPQPGGVQDLRLFRNGSLVKAWRGDLQTSQGRTAFETTVALTSGENRFTAYVFNRDNVKSADALRMVRSTAPARQGTAYLLAIGVNKYSNRDFNLNFAAPDATLLAELLPQGQQRMGTWAKTVPVRLLDEQATKANIMLALARLGGTQTGPLPAGTPAQLEALSRVQPEDSVVVFFAGHGTTAGDRFYLVPHDLGYNGPRDNVTSGLDAIHAHSISDQDLERAFEPVDATAGILLIIDACYSGKALDSQEERRGPLNSKGLAQLAWEKGMYVLTAAQAYQAAIESSEYGHGYLTYALAEEGLAKFQADTQPIDGQITAIEWFEYALRRVPQLQSNAKKPVTTTAKTRLLTYQTGQPQTPRVYYRRDDPAPTPVVARR